MKKNTAYLAIATLLLGTSAVHAGIGTSPLLPSPDRALPETAAGWWTWYEADESVASRQGAVDCSHGQSGAVWFLAGTDGSGPMQRHCSVPVGTTLFFPHVTMSFFNDVGETYSIDEKRFMLDDFLTESLPGNGNEPGYRACGVALSVDGVSGPASGVQTTRGQSDLFLSEGDPEAVADGFWSAVDLAPGQHVLRIQGGLCQAPSDQFLFEVDVTYHIEVR
jgi:hypothetical protein